MNRRNFFRVTGGLAATGWMFHSIPGWLKEQAGAHGMKIGFQSWTIREQLNKDFPATLKMMAGLGYQQIEMCSPKGYEQIGFGPLAKLKTSELRAMIADAGMSCPSCHFGFGELKDNLDERIDFARELGLTQMILSTFWLPKTASLKDYLAAADTFNLIAEKIKNAGLQAGFHNHEFEFATLDGHLIYDALMERFDQALVRMQFQTEVINLGYKAAEYFNRYPGRFISAHLSDWTTDKKEASLGKGVIDWKEFFAAAHTGGVENMFVEMAQDKFKDSASFLRSV